MEEVLSFPRSTEHIQHVLHGESPEVLTYSSLVQTETKHSPIELKGFLSTLSIECKNVQSTEYNDTFSVQ